MSDLQLDLDREARIGVPEAILCAGKSHTQLRAILQQAKEASASLLLTRLASDHGLDDLDYDPDSGTAFFGPLRPVLGVAQVAIVTAGTSDSRVARECARTLRFLGHAYHEVYDAGVAGLWRLLNRVDELKRMHVVIVIAGMDGALPSVVGGLVPGLVIAVPTSTGYGVADAGRTALHAALCSCSSGIVAVNIDNGYGAAVAAARILKHVAL